MNRLIVDMSSVCWTSLLAGKDEEFAKKVEFEGKVVSVNSAAFGFENAMNMILGGMEKAGVVPSQVILVVEGMNSKSLRRRILPGYKDTRDTRPPEAYEEFNKLKGMLVEAFLAVGASSVTQDGLEADDVIAYLAQNLDGERYILSRDGDLLQLVQESPVTIHKASAVGMTEMAPQASEMSGIHLIRGNDIDTNTYGPFPTRYVTLRKSLVGKPDEVPGAFKFGEKSFLDLYAVFGDEGCDILIGLIERKELAKLAEDVGELKSLQRIIDSADLVYKSYAAAKLYPERVNTMRMPLVWGAGMVKPLTAATDERLKPWAASSRIVTEDNFEKALAFLQSRVAETPFFCLDLETTVPAESEEWLANRTAKGGGVDVIGSTIVGCGITFGSNNQYGYYISVDHKDTNNVLVEQLATMLEAIPATKITLAQNAAGFELPVMYNTFSPRWKNNGWRGFFPNMVDTRIAAAYWDENQFSHGLKQMSKLLLGYDQVTYEQVTTKISIVDGVEVKTQYKMDELTATGVMSYGLDDVYCTQAIWNFYRTTMELEGTFETFMLREQKPMYLAALSYVNGTNVSLQKLFELKGKDDVSEIGHLDTLNSYLIKSGWAGTVCPEWVPAQEYAEEVQRGADILGLGQTDTMPSGHRDISRAADIKEAILLYTGRELKTAVRKIERIADAIAEQFPDDPALARAVRDQDAKALTALVASRFDGTPKFDVASPKQIKELMYGKMGIPVRLRNKATEVMRKNGIFEDTPRTDEDAMLMAIKQGDAPGDLAPVLSALMELKSINTRRGLYWNTYPKAIHWKTGKMHPELKQCATNTLRHTSSNVNIQQMDSTPGGVRSCIIPHHKDAVILSCDESGQEIRLLADLSGDENMLSAYIGDNLKDLHSFTAAMILGVSYEEFRSRFTSADKEVAEAAAKARQVGKTVFFASSYGAMAKKIAEGLGVSEAEAQGYLDALERAFPRVGEWKLEVENMARSKGYVQVFGGSRRHLSGALLSEDKWVAQKALRQASNASIQGAAGHQIRRVMGRLWDSYILDKYDVQFVFVLHDEVILSVGKKDAVEAIPLIHALMCEQFLDVLPSVSSIGIGRSYGDLIEIGEVADPEKIGAAVAEALA